MSSATLKISSSLSNFSSLNNGVVWALYLLHVIFRIAFFCNLAILPRLKPQFSTPYCKCGNTRDEYINLRVFCGNVLFSLQSNPTVRDILFDIFWVCKFQFRFSSKTITFHFFDLTHPETDGYFRNTFHYNHTLVFNIWPVFVVISWLRTRRWKLCGTINHWAGY